MHFLLLSQQAGQQRAEEAVAVLPVVAAMLVFSLLVVLLLALLLALEVVAATMHGVVLNCLVPAELLKEGEVRPQPFLCHHGRHIPTYTWG